MASARKRVSQEENPTPKCTLFVRNLPFEATDESLEEVFSEVGPIKSCFVVKERGVKDKCRGFGFVTYADRNDAQKAVSSSHNLDGRTIHVKYADKKPPSDFSLKKRNASASKGSPTKHSFFNEDKDDADDQGAPRSPKWNQKKNQQDSLSKPPQKVQSTSTSPAKHSFFDNDNDEEEEEDSGDDNVEDLLKQINEVNQKKKQKTDQKQKKRDEQKQKSQNAANKAPQKPQPTQTEQSANKKATEQSKQNAQKGQRTSNETKGQRTSTNESKKIEAKKQDKTSGAGMNVKASQKKSQEANQKTARLVIRNLSFKCSEDDLKKAFSVHGNVTEVRVPRMASDPRKSRGFGFVQYEEVKSAAAALEAINGQKIKGRPVAVDWSLPREKFLAVSKKASSPPKSAKTSKPTKPESSTSSGSESGSDSNDDLDDDSDEDEPTTTTKKGPVVKSPTAKQTITQPAKRKLEDESSSDDDDESEDESDDEEETTAKKGPIIKSATAKQTQPIKRKVEEDDSSSDDESEDDSEEEETTTTKKGASVKSPTAQSRTQPAKKKLKDDSSSDEDSDSGNGDKDSESESDSDDEEPANLAKKHDRDSGGIHDEDDDDSDDGEEESDDEDDSDEDEEEEISSKKKEQSRPSDVGEGKTLFIRNVPYESRDADLRAIFEKFGQLEVCRVVMDRETEHSKGSAFVKYSSKEEVERCLRKANAQTQDEQFTIDGRHLEVSMALPRNDIEQMRKALKKQEKSVNKDKRNLYLLREGLVREGTNAAKGVPETEMAKRTKIESIKRNKLKNINIFVSPTRMVVHNLSKAVDDAKLRKIFLEGAGDKKARVIEARIMRDMKRPSSEGKCPPLGYAFVEFTEHEHALAALRHVNNNATYFGDTKRPIVGFSLENKTVLEAKMKRQAHQAQNKAGQKTGQKPGQKPGQKTDQRDRAKTGPSQSEVAKKTHIASLSKDKLHTAPKTKIRKGLPSHMGPKKRWRDKGKIPPPKKDKSRVSRAQKFQDREPKEPQTKRIITEQGVEKAPKRRRMTADRREEANFNKLVTQYKTKLFGNETRTDAQRKQPKSKWFDNN